MLDIDFFKKVNDEYGHVVGDKVLLKMARIITSLLREYDPFGRIGGEEFGIFLPNTSLQQAKEITQRLCDTINASQFNTSSKPISISVSIGIVQCWQGATFESLYSCADVALYEAKDKGRNQVAVHSNSLSSLDPG
ncbi:GGDEF domain-containing protein [Paraglaciecola aquimarina]|uniref:diguanylate cyclase n=1 Tax=Paraglaciecola aquimarina TaxID=1235557 RepID=A0ABU3STA4_9ALTE|nr:GGDEF domain-containing protein [Paraglaciecola aquimarina]MDU0353212.1 GGDEF domain-containing protein [Paraglaciecola aquimarina]